MKLTLDQLKAVIRAVAYQNSTVAMIGMEDMLTDIDADMINQALEDDADWDTGQILTDLVANPVQQSLMDLATEMEVTRNKTFLGLGVPGSMLIKPIKKPKATPERTLTAIMKRPDLLNQVTALAISQGFIKLASAWHKHPTLGHVKRSRILPTHLAGASMGAVYNNHWEVHGLATVDGIGFSDDDYGDKGRAKVDEILRHNGWLLL